MQWSEGDMAAEKKVTTVTLKDLAASLAETHGVAKSQMNGILAGMVEDLGKHLKKGARIRISGLGILQVRKRPARMGRNPATGEAIKIPAKTVVKARIVKQLKDAVLPRK
jgi:DNA-binding protein HU-beta